MAQYESASIKTDQTTLEIYPHTETTFHYMMGFLTFFVILPLSSMLLPVLILVKLVLYTPICIFFDPRLSGNFLFKTITRIKNLLLTPFHYCVFKVHYTFSAIWMSCFMKYDDYWYGVDLAPYQDYEDYVTSFRDSRVRWRYKKKLKTFKEWDIKEKIVPDHLAFFKILFSRQIYSLVKEADLRKNKELTDKKKNRLGILLVRDYFLLLLLPVRMHIYEKDGTIVGLCTYLKKGNTLTMCQHVIADEFNRSGLYYHQMNQCFLYAFGDPKIRYVSCSFTSGQSKQTSGCHPINYLLSDEFKFIPFRSFQK